MQMNERNDIQGDGLKEIANLAYTIARTEGITTILSAMKNHSSNATVQENGCAALWTLADNNNENKEKIASFEGNAVIYNAIQNHSSNAGVTKKGYKALRKFEQSQKQLRFRS